MTERERPHLPHGPRHEPSAVDVTYVRAQPLVAQPDASAQAFAARYSPSSYLDIGTACPLHCAYCSVDRGPDDKQLRWAPTEELQRQMADAHAVGMRKLTFIGGEPASRPDFFAICDTAYAQGFTDLTLTTKSVKIARPEFVAQLRAHHVSLVHLSLDSFDRDVLAIHLRSQTVPEQLLRGLEVLLQSGIDVFLFVVLTRHNLPGLEDYVRRVAALSQQYGRPLTVLSTPLKLQSRAAKHADDLVAPLAEVGAEVGKAVRLAQQLGVTWLHKSLPPCVIPGLQAFALETYLTEGRLQVGTGVDLAAFRPGAMQFGPGCTGCTAQSLCPGVDSAYIARAGWGEFNALGAGTHG